jgi:methylmalonyl-CoA mutase C-terminal domain/subunit
MFLENQKTLHAAPDNNQSGSPSGVVIGGVSFSKIPRVLIAKPGLDGHDRGAKYIAKALRDAGMEVIYTGIRQSPDEIAITAVQEDVDIVGLSLLSGAHTALFPRVIDALKRQGGADIPVIGGGIIPDEDIPDLIKSGVAAIFTPGTRIEDVITNIKKILENEP